MTKLFTALIQGYRWGISPMFPPVCRFYPTCSSYAVEALAKYGCWKGGLMAVRRLLRCHPFGGNGYDPVE